MLKFIYLFMQYQLKNLMDSNNQPLFKLVDRWKNQTNNYTGTRETPLPAVYIQVSQGTDFEEFPEKMIVGIYDINVFIATERYLGSELGDYQQNESLDLYYLADRVSELHLSSMEDQTKLLLNNLYFPKTGQIIDGINYTYPTYLVGPLHINLMKDVSGGNDDLDVYQVSFRTRVNNNYNSPKYVDVYGLTGSIIGLTGSVGMIDYMDKDFIVKSTASYSVSI